MYYKSRLLFIYLGLLLGLGSCKIDTLGDPIVIADVKDEFLVDMYEKLTPNGRGLNFEIATIEAQQCSNTEIGFKYQQNGAQIEISIREITPPADCRSGDAPVSVEIGTDPLLRGLYFLHIDLREAVRNQGRLQVTDEFYQVIFEQKNGIIFRTDRIFRIPEGLIWGKLRIPMARTDIYEAWKAEITGYLTDAELPAGNYGHFTVNEDGSVRLRQSADNSATTFQFVYAMHGAREAIRRLIEDFQVRYPNTDLELIDSQGYTY